MSTLFKDTGRSNIFAETVATKYFFFHNPKAAGSSVREWLVSQTGLSDCPSIENNIVEHNENSENYEKFKGFSLYCGHYGMDIFRAVSDGHVPITNFRHPVSRMVSLFNYFRHAVSVPEGQIGSDAFFAVKAAQSMNFYDFINSQDPRILTYTFDQHFRQLTGSFYDIENDVPLSDAFTLIDRMPWFYVVEFPDFSSRWAHALFQWRISELKVLNKTPNFNHILRLDTISTKEKERAMEINRRDVAIYDHAVRRLKNEMENARNTTLDILI